MVFAKRFPEQATALPAQETDTNQANAQQIVDSVPKSTVALAIIVAVFGAFFLICFIAWKIRARRRRRNGVLSLDGSVEPKYSGQSDEKHVDLEPGYGIEKPEKAFGAPEVTPYLGTSGWVPQIRTYHGVPVKQLPKDLQVSLEDRKFKGNYSFAPSEKTPPPAYVVANGGSERESTMGGPIAPPSIPLPPIPETVATASVPPTPPTPPATKTLLKIPKTLTSRFSAETPILSPGSAADPMPSPIRNESFRQQQRLHPPALPGFKPPKRKNSEPPLPRVMTVISTFTPSQDDELPINVSETVRMLEEYRDGWCLIQRMDANDAPQGVVPRFCLVERQTVIPASSPSHRSKFSLTTGSKI